MPDSIVEEIAGAAEPAVGRGIGNKTFTVLMAGSSISMFGSRISTVAFPMLILHLSGSPFVAGLVAFAVIAPSMLVYIPAGALVDRWNPRRVMLVSEFGRGIAIAMVVLVLVLGSKSVFLPIIAMVAEEILEIFSALAERRYINGLVERGKASYAQACIEVRTHAVVVAGRPLGPLLFEIKPIWPFVADAASFLASVASIICTKGKKVDFDSLEPMSMKQLRSDVGDGFQWLYHDKYARHTIGLLAGTTLIAQALILIFLAEAHAQQLSSFALGVMLAASGAGGALGAVAAGRLPGRVKSAWMRIQMCTWCIALFFLVKSGDRSFLWIAAVMAVLGFTGAIGNIVFGTYLVGNVADGMLARVTSIGQVLAIGACAIGPVLGGMAIQRCGIQGAIWLLFLIVVFLVFIPARMPVLPGQGHELRQPG